MVTRCPQDAGSFASSLLYVRGMQFGSNGRGARGRRRRKRSERRREFTGDPPVPGNGGDPEDEPDQHCGNCQPQQREVALGGGAAGGTVIDLRAAAPGLEEHVHAGGSSQQRQQGRQPNQEPSEYAHAPTIARPTRLDWAAPQRAVRQLTWTALAGSESAAKTRNPNPDHRPPWRMLLTVSGRATVT